MDSHVVIPSARFSNLETCVQSILKQEPNLPHERIIVVDDGARRDAPWDFPRVLWVEGVKPFVYARNVNLGIRKAPGDVILMNDDAQLVTPGGFSVLSGVANADPNIGLCSAAIQGFVGNEAQQVRHEGLRDLLGTAAFICPYLPKSTLDRIGLLDERFTAYGGDDMDYTERVRRAGLKVCVLDACVVSHGEIPSTFRTRPDIQALFQEGLRQYHEKYA